MINYEYEYLFYEHKSVDYIITDPDATITPVANSAPTIADYKFLITNEELRNESIALSESICSDRNLKFGKTEASKFSFTFRTEGKDYQSDLTGEEIVVYLYFNGNSSTLFQVGRYIIQSDQYTNDRTIRNITAYDILYFLNDYDITEWYNENLSDTPVAISTLRTSLFNWLSTSEGFNISQESTSLVNDSVTLTNNIESDVITFEFFMQRVLEVNGCFGHINRQGIFEYKYINWYDSTSVKLLENSDREPVLQYEPYTVKGIAYINAYDRDNIRIGRVGSSNFKRPNTYSIVDSFALNDVSASSMASILSTMLNKVTHLRYRPMTARIMGNLCLEVGDKVDIQYGIDEEDIPITFYTYIFSRSFRGIQAMRDIISAKGDQTQPEYVIQERWHQGDSNRGTGGSGRSGVSQYYDIDWQKFCEVIRNIGYRLLDEPSNVNVVYNKEDGQVEIEWEDPADIVTNYPVPVEWAGTVIVRSEGNPPLHRFDGDYGGTVLVDSTTRDAYKVNAYVDNSIQGNKRYYYGIFPYHVAIDDANLPIKQYRSTKVISVDTHVYLTAPTIESLEVSGTDVTVTYSIPEIEGLYSYCTLVYKKGGISANVNDGTPVSLNESLTTKIVSGLDEESRYYFVIFTADTDGNTASSEPQDCMTGEEIVPSYMQEVGTYNFDSDENKHNFKTCAKYQNGSYLGGNWGWDFSMYSVEGMMATTNKLETCLYEDGATVSIDTSNGIDITYTGFTIKSQAYFWGTGRPHIGLDWEGGGAPEGAYFCGGTSETYYPTRNDFETLDEAFEWIYKSFRRINLIVDGVTYVEIHD